MQVSAARLQANEMKHCYEVIILHNILDTGDVKRDQC